MRKLTKTPQRRLAGIPMLLATLAAITPALGQPAGGQPAGAQPAGAQQATQPSAEDPGASVSASLPTSPEEIRKLCLARHVHAQVARRNGELLDARADLLLCSRPACPGVVRADCSDWYSEVNRTIPSVVIAARSEKGDEVNVKVTLDGKPLTKAADGKPIEMNPGPHKFHFELPPWPAVDQTVVMHEGDKSRNLPVFFGDPDKTLAAATIGAPPPAAEYRPVPNSVYVLLGGSVLFAASATVFTLKGFSDKKALTCTPFCTSEELSKPRTDFLIGDLSIGAAAVSAGVAIALFATRPVKTRDSAKPEVGTTEAPHVGLRPTYAGASVDVSGRI